MQLVVGLGNPGRRYAATRHNVGVRVVERFAARAGLALDAPRFAGRFGHGVWQGRDLAVLASETWMNHSGQAVAAAVETLPVTDPTRDLLVVFDDVDLPFGELRLRPRGGAGGHRGMGDVVDRVGTPALPRLRFGVGRPPEGVPTEVWVLGDFGPAEERSLPGRLDHAAEAVGCFLEEGIAVAMNRFNGAS